MKSTLAAALAAVLLFTGASQAAGGTDEPVVPDGTTLESLALNPAETAESQSLAAARVEAMRSAVLKGDERTVRELLAAGLAPNVMLANGDTAFTYAMRSDHPNLARLILEAEGFAIDQPNRFGETPLMLAVFKGDKTLFEELLERGASLESRPLSWTPLHYAATEGREDFVKILLEKGADVNAQTRGGVTPLMMAARKPSRAVAVQLLKAGAYRDYCTDKGLSPADFARRAGDEKLADYLAVERCAVVGPKGAKSAAPGSTSGSPAGSAVVKIAPAGSAFPPRQ